MAIALEQLLANLAEGSIEMPPPVQVLPDAPMVFTCSFAAGGMTPEELEPVRGQYPADLVRFWATYRWATLFHDVTYGQWGLELLPWDRAVTITREFEQRRAKDHLEGDFVAGQFFGDSQLLLIRCDHRTPDFGSITIAEPIYSRADWEKAADTLEEFLNLYVQARGTMYWMRDGK